MEHIEENNVDMNAEEIIKANDMLTEMEKEVIELKVRLEEQQKRIDELINSIKK